MKLICLLTHGLGDFYYPLSILPSFMKERNIPPENLKIYVDSIYFVDPSPGYVSSRLTAIKMIETVTKNWEAVPSKFFGSGDFFGIPNRRLGPQYEHIKHDFIYYRLPQLKTYMRSVIEESQKQEDTLFIYGPCLWMVEWKNNENIPIDLSKRASINIGISDEEKSKMDEFLGLRSILIHVRLKGGGVNSHFFTSLIGCCVNHNIKPILVGIKSEMRIDPRCWAIDLRECISVEQNMYLTEKCNYAILSSSMFSYHRLFFNKETIINVPMSNNGLTGFFKNDILNPRHLFLDSDRNNIDVVINKIKMWFDIK
jgi:hypothetical protein